MNLIKNPGELRDLAIVYLTRANGSVNDSVDAFEAALSETSPVIAALFAGPNEALKVQIAVYLDAIQSDLAYLFQEGIARDDAILKERQVQSSIQAPAQEASVLSMEGLAKRVAKAGLGGGDER
jgi:hypothetical protein